MYLLSKNAKVTRVANGAAAGTGTTNGTGLDMKDFDAVTFVALIGAITATGTVTLKAQQSDDDGATDAYSDLEGTAIAYADDDDDQVAVLEICQPRKRYVRAVVVRATANAVLDGVIALQTRAQAQPVTHDATTVLGAELHQAPAEGTA